MSWQEQGLCADPKNRKYVELFFSDVASERYEAKNLCFACPVRKDCIKYALESKEIWGIWGGKDQNEIRRTLSVNVDGNEVRRGRYPQCPYCSARTKDLTAAIVDDPDGGRWTVMRVVTCGACTFSWRSRTSANAVNAYHAEKADKKSKRYIASVADDPEDTLF
jgi:WhiB family redox-sensing transcriptional regulator